MAPSRRREKNFPAIRAFVLKDLKRIAPIINNHIYLHRSPHKNMTQKPKQLTHQKPKTQIMKKLLKNLTPAKLQQLLILILIGAALIVAIVFIFYLSNFNGDISSNNSDWGTFGDFIGGTLNPLLSFLGLIALLLTISLQSKELELTRNELERTASAQEKTEAALSEQSKTQIRQQFEGTFFALLEQHNKALEKISAPSEKRTTKHSDLEIIRNNVILRERSSLSEAKKALEAHNDLCGHYFRILYQILKYIATKTPESNVGDNFDSASIQNKPLAHNEKMYSNMLRAFLSYDATQILAINCYCEDEADPYWKFKLLIERYAFLEHMPFHIGQRNPELLNLTKDHYESKAFGASQFNNPSITR